MALRYTQGRPPHAQGAYVALLLCAFVSLSFTAHGQARYSEEEVKAAFLYRFTGYVDWPAEALEQESFTIAVLGRSEVVDELQRLVPGRSIKNLPARVRRIERVKEIGNAQVLYVAAAYPERLKQVMQQLGSKPVLVVSDRPDGLEDGATVNFVTLDRRVRFEISIASANRAQLKIGAELLSLAARVLGSSSRAEARCSNEAACACDESQACIDRWASL